MEFSPNGFSIVKYTLRSKVQWSARLEVLPGSLLKSGQSEVLKSIICHDKDRTRTPVERPEVKPNRNLIAGGVDVSPDIRYLDIAILQKFKKFTQETVVWRTLKS